VRCRGVPERARDVTDPPPAGVQQMLDCGPGPTGPSSAGRTQPLADLVTAPIDSSRRTRRAATGSGNCARLANAAVDDARPTQHAPTRRASASDSSAGTGNPSRACNPADNGTATRSGNPAGPTSSGTAITPAAAPGNRAASSRSTGANANSAPGKNRCPRRTRSVAISCTRSSAAERSL
jgi:hypothetical protein